MSSEEACSDIPLSLGMLMVSMPLYANSFSILTIIFSFSSYFGSAKQKVSVSFRWIYLSLPFTIFSIELYG